MTDQPPPSGFPPPPPPGYSTVPAAPPGPPAWTDPKGLGAAAARLSTGSRKRGRVPLLIAAALLDDELVEAVVQGRVHGFDGAAVLTTRRLLVVNAREWQPDVISVEPGPDLAVQGWQDDRTAALVVQKGDQSVAIDGIDDRPLAVEFAQRLRAKANPS
jgi:hypothetical protein